MSTRLSAWPRVFVRRGLLFVSLILASATATSTFVVAAATAAPPAGSVPRAAAVPVAAVPQALAGPAAAVPVAAVPAARTAGCGGGPLAFGQIVVCPAISGTEQHVYTVTTSRNADALFTTLTRGSGDWISGSISASDGTFVCPLFSDAGTCQLGAAGSYTITVSLAWGGNGNYSLAVDSTQSPSSCAPLPNSFFSFASPGVTATLAAGAAAHCYRFNQPVGTVLQIFAPGRAGQVRGTILDAQFEPLCPVDATTTCTLVSPGPYRLFLREAYGAEASYTVRMPRISNSAGCPTLKLARFGDPGDAVGTGTVERAYDTTCHKLKNVTATAVMVRLSPDQELWWTIYDDAGQEVCDRNSAPRSCQLSGTGDHTLLVQNQNIFGTRRTFGVAVVALSRTAGCAPRTSTSWDTPALVVRPTSPLDTHCQPFTGNAGDRIVHFAAPNVYNSVPAWIADQSGAEVCPNVSSEAGCVLPATGTYRLISHLGTWNPDEDPTYRLQVRRLSNPAGCPTVSPGSYGTPPAPGGIRCRVLDIPAAGTYRVRAVGVDNYELSGQVFTSAGLRHSCGTVLCRFDTPGRYTWVLDPSPGSVVDNDVRYAFTLLSAVPSGCPQVSDTGYAGLPYRSQFSGPGQHNCVQLASPAGARVIELLPTDAAGAGRPSTIVVDSTGNYVCDSLRYYACELTGAAPFFAVHVSDGGNPTGGYAVAYARVDGPPACPVLPRTADGTTVTTGADRFAVCLSIPADQHAAQEAFTYRRTSGSGTASISVYDSAGFRYCGPTGPSADRTVTCTLPGGPLTVIVETGAVDATYQFTRRDPAAPAP